jgi:hypothetical protein
MIDTLIEGYHCELPIIESVLKINKLNHTKFLLSTKIKKKIIKNCNIVVPDPSLLEDNFLNDKKSNKKYKK